jgi:hypothetical protein
MTSKNQWHRLWVPLTFLLITLMFFPSGKFRLTFGTVKERLYFRK